MFHMLYLRLLLSTPLSGTHSHPQAHTACCFTLTAHGRALVLQAGLQQRLGEQEQAFLVMKAELLRAGFAQQALESAKVWITR